MGLRLTASPMIHVDMAAKPGLQYAVNLFYEQPDQHGVFAQAFGRDAHEARLRADLICMAVNKLKPVDEVGLRRSEAYERD